MKNILWVVIVIVFALLIGFISGASVSLFIDAEAIIAELGVMFLVLFFAGLIKDFFKSFSIINRKKDFSLSELRRSSESVKLAMLSLCTTGILVFFISLISALRDLTDLQSIGQNLAVAFLVVLYAAVLVLILLPLFFKIKVMISDYMNKED